VLAVKLGMLAGSFVVATGSVEAFTAALWGMMRNPYALAIGAIIAMIAYDWVGAWDQGKAAQTSALGNL